MATMANDKESGFSGFPKDGFVDADLLAHLFTLSKLEEQGEGAPNPEPRPHNSNWDFTIGQLASARWQLEQTRLRNALTDSTNDDFDKCLEMATNLGIFDANAFNPESWASFYTALHERGEIGIFAAVIELLSKNTKVAPFTSSTIEWSVAPVYFFPNDFFANNIFSIDTNQTIPVKFEGKPYLEGGSPQIPGVVITFTPDGKCLLVRDTSNRFVTHNKTNAELISDLDPEVWSVADFSVPFSVECAAFASFTASPARYLEQFTSETPEPKNARIPFLSSSIELMMYKAQPGKRLERGDLWKKTHSISYSLMKHEWFSPQAFNPTQFVECLRFCLQHAVYHKAY